jgi:hypothetical protein
MIRVDDSMKSPTQNTPPVSTVSPNTTQSPKPSRPREATRQSLAEDRRRIQKADLSKVKVW